MFTGIIEEVGQVHAIDVAADSGHAELGITATTVTDGIQLGESIAVDGCCLTVARMTPEGFVADLMAETLAATALGHLTTGARVNLERAMRADGRFGGHVVQGHVDGVGEVVDLVSDPGTTWVTVRAPASIARHLVPKGSITMAGVSLTVVDVSDHADGRATFRVALIPHTLDHTTFATLEVGLAGEPRVRRHRQVRRTARRIEPGRARHPHTTVRHPEERTMSLAAIDDAIAVIRDGGMVLVVDDEDRENEGDLVMAADAATPEALGFIIRHSSGVICAPMLGEDLDRLALPMMVAVNEDPKGTAYTISVDAVGGTTTGISAADRARTITALADPSSTAADFSRPGHVFPLRYAEGGVLRRPGHTEASVDLARLAGRRPAALICEVVNDDGSMARLPDLEVFARDHGLLVVSIADLVSWRRRRDSLVERVVEVPLPTAYGDWQLIGYRNRLDGVEHVAAVHGDIGGDEPTLVRMHSECLTGDVFRSRRCDCGAQLDVAMEQIQQRGSRSGRLPAWARGSWHRPAQQVACLSAAGPGCGHRRREPGPGVARGCARLRRRCLDPG